MGAKPPSTDLRQCRHGHSRWRFASLMTFPDRRKTSLYVACKALGIKKWAGFAMNCKLGLKRCQQQRIVSRRSVQSPLQDRGSREETIAGSGAKPRTQNQYLPFAPATNVNWGVICCTTMISKAACTPAQDNGPLIQASIVENTDCPLDKSHSASCTNRLGHCFLP